MEKAQPGPGVVAQTCDHTEEANMVSKYPLAGRRGKSSQHSTIVNVGFLHHLKNVKGLCKFNQKDLKGCPCNCKLTKSLSSERKEKSRDFKHCCCCFHLMSTLYLRSGLDQKP